MDEKYQDEQISQFKTIKAAMAAGYLKLHASYYGVPVVMIKGHQFVMKPKIARSKTEWNKLGFKVKTGEKPHATDGGRVGGRHRMWDVFRDDQVESFKKRIIKPPTSIPILQALWTINRHAKRLRDRAKIHWDSGQIDLAGNSATKKRQYYKWKAQCLHNLIEDGTLKVVGHHRFGVNGVRWAEVVAGSGYWFHRPCCPVDALDVPIIDEIDAKPKRIAEARLCDAEYTIYGYLVNREEVVVYEWPMRQPEAVVQEYYQVDDEDECDVYGDYCDTSSPQSMP